MTDDIRRKGLGRGLAALLGDDAAEEASQERMRGVREIPIEQLQPGRYQPRLRFEAEALEALTESVRAKGILSPIIVRKTAAPNTFEIVAGERRWRAAQKARLHHVPVLIKELTDGEALEIALVENVQRQDLNAVEEAQGYQRLMDEFSYTQEQLSGIIGKSRSHIANTLRLLNLPEQVRTMIEKGEISAGHARAIASSADPAALARQIVDGRMSVRQAEELAAAAKPIRKKIAALAKSGAGGRPKDADTLAFEREIAAALGLNVSVEHKGDAGGEVRISYKTLEQLDEIAKRLMRTPPAGPNLQVVKG